MKRIVIAATVVLLAAASFSCKSGASVPASFCDTACFKDTAKFTQNEHPLKPYVYITGADCNADTLAWSYSGMESDRKMGLKDLIGIQLKLNKEAIGCFIKDTSYFWLSFNDCSNGRGYLLKFPFNKTGRLGIKASAINKFDPKFAVADGLIAYSDRGNLFTEDVATGKQAMMTFGEKLDIDYDAIHEFIDSVNITPTRIWAKVKIGEEWKELQKNIELK